MTLNMERLLANLKETGLIGKSDRPAGGIDRLAFSENYYKSAEVFADLLREAGLSVTKDRIGNIIGRRAGQNDSLPAVVLGSHLDTVKDGGLYDGNLGCIAALECMFALREAGMTTQHPIEVIGFSAEEGGPMGGTFGSRAMMGKENAVDENSRVAMPGCGITLEDTLSARRDPGSFHSFLELHIEQGSVLEREGFDVGIVTGIVGITRCLITIDGASNHAGTTPMSYRRDALTAAARLICRMHELAEKYPDPFVFTIGNVEVFPGVATVIPGQVKLQLEMRDLDQGHIEDFLSRTTEAANRLEGVAVDIHRQITKLSAAMDPGVMDLIQSACSAIGVSSKRMASGAGHDAQMIASAGVPTGMIFLPSREGISHNPAEYTAPEFIEKGVQVLLGALLRLDEAVSD